MAVGDVYAFPGFLTPVQIQISFQSHRLLFSHASAEVRGENMPERNFASTGVAISVFDPVENILEEEKNGYYQHFPFFKQCLNSFPNNPNF